MRDLNVTPGHNKLVRSEQMISMTNPIFLLALGWCTEQLPASHRMRMNPIQ